MVVGGTFYGNHLLFQRLYESVQDQVDSLAEKIMGYLGGEPIALNYQMRHISEYTYRWSSIGCNHKRGLQSEEDLQGAIKRAYDGIKKAQAMTLGLDDWLMATANAHERNSYLLQQALAPIPGEPVRVTEKQAGREPRSRADLIGFLWTLHDALEREITYSFEDIQEMSNADLRRATKRMSEHLENTPMGDEKLVWAKENSPAAYRQLSRMSGGKVAFEDVNPSDLFDAPNHREVLEFADSGAITNDPEVAREAVREDNLSTSPSEVVRDAEKAPPTPEEIAKEPGGAEFSTLNRYVVTTEQPGASAKKGAFEFWANELRLR